MLQLHRPTHHSIGLNRTHFNLLPLAKQTPHYLILWLFFLIVRGKEGEEALHAKKEREGGAIPRKCGTSTMRASLIGAGLSKATLY